MRHKANSVSAFGPTNTSNSYNVWFIDSSVSNHMTSHGEWLHDLRIPEWLGYVETRDDTTHPNRHVHNVPLKKEGNKTCIKNVLHVLTITKNWVSVGQIVEQGMQVWLNNGGCIIKKKGQLIAKGWREGRMFILYSNKVESPMYAKGLKVDKEIELWYKRVGHISLQKFKGKQSNGVIIRFPTFKEKGIDGVCEACQFGKQHRHPFPK